MIMEPALRSNLRYCDGLRFSRYASSWRLALAANLVRSGGPQVDRVKA